MQSVHLIFSLIKLRMLQVKKKGGSVLKRKFVLISVQSHGRKAHLDPAGKEIEEQS